MRQRTCSISILARQLRRVARILKLAEVNEFHWAKVCMERMPEILKNFQDYFDDILDSHKEDSSQIVRKIYNLMTKADSETKSFLEQAKKRVDELIPPCLSVFEKASKADTLQNLRLTVYTETDRINELLRLMAQISKKIAGMKHSLTSKNSMMLDLHVDGVETWKMKFVEAIKSAMGL